MSDSDKLMRQLRRLSFVPRWQIFPTNRRQSVADHSFHVTTISMWLMEKHTRRENNEFTLQVLLYALTHDADEAVTGDTPSPNKTPNYDRPQHETVVKLADGLEAYAFLMEEQKMGNTFVNTPLIDDVLGRTYPYYEKFAWDPHPNGKPSWPNFLKEFRLTVMHPKWNHPVIEWMMEDKDAD